MVAESMTLNYSFSITVWLYGEDLNFIYCPKIHIRTDLSIYMTLKNSEKSFLVQINGECNLPYWKFMAITVEFYNNATHITSWCGQISYKVRSISGFVFYDSPGPLNVTSLTSFRWVYRMVVAQYAIKNMTDQSICTDINSVSCLSNSTMNQTAIPYNGKYLNCDPSCTSGCLTYGTCNQCKNKLCSICDGFNETCTPTNDTQFQPCFSGFKLSVDTNNCCYERCSACFGFKGYLCSRCYSPYVLAGSICTLKCPSGYTLNGDQRSDPCQKSRDLYSEFINDFHIKLYYTQQYYYSLLD